MIWSALKLLCALAQRVICLKRLERDARLCAPLLSLGSSPAPVHGQAGKVLRAQALAHVLLALGHRHDVLAAQLVPPWYGTTARGAPCLEPVRVVPTWAATNRPNASKYRGCGVLRRP